MLIQQILLGIALGAVLAHEDLLLVRLMLEQLMVAQALLVRKGSVAQITPASRQGLISMELLNRVYFFVGSFTLPLT